MGPVELLILLPLVVGPAALVGRVAARFGRSPVLFFVFALVLLWPAALITLMLLGKTPAAEEAHAAASGSPRRRRRARGRP